MSGCNSYIVLGLSPPCSLHEIRKAYLRAALSCHPDRHPNDVQATQKFQEVSIAYQTLTAENLDTIDSGSLSDEEDDRDIDIHKYKQMFENISDKVKLFCKKHRTEIALANTLWSSLKSQLVSIAKNVESKDKTEYHSYTNDDLNRSDSNISSKDVADNIPSLQKTPPILLNIETTRVARLDKDIHKVEYTRLRWNHLEKRILAETSAILVPIEHDEIVFPGEGDWIEPHKTIAGDVIVFVSVSKNTV